MMCTQETVSNIVYVSCLGRVIQLQIKAPEECRQRQIQLRHSNPRWRHQHTNDSRSQTQRKSPHALAHSGPFPKRYKVPIQLRVSYPTGRVELLGCRKDSRMEQDIIGRHADRCLHNVSLEIGLTLPRQAAVADTDLLYAVSPNHHTLAPPPP